MASEDLKPRQYKRVGRIAENNPERAERVAERMTTKSEREEKGKKIADKYSSSKQRPQAPLERLKSDKMPNSQYENLKNELKTTSYDSINFKNKDVDKFKGRFGKGESQPWEIEAIKTKKP